MDTATNPVWVIVLVGALSGVLGSILGPILTRLFTRSDRALDARREWAREKLQTVFGIGDPKYAPDGPMPPSMRLIPPNSYAPHALDMHSINPAIEESVDLMMLQPVRSSWARQWLYNWHFALSPEAYYLHRRMHIAMRTQPAEKYADAILAWEKADKRYQRRARRVASALSIWAIGQWITHPSIRMWLSNRKLVQTWRGRKDLRRNKKGLLLYDNPLAECDCTDWIEPFPEQSDAANVS